MVKSSLGSAKFDVSTEFREIVAIDLPSYLLSENDNPMAIGCLSDSIISVRSHFTIEDIKLMIID